MVTVIEHDHPLKLIDLQVNDEDVEEAEADEEEEKDVVIQKDFVCPCKCKRCDQPIHEYYSTCEVYIHPECALLLPGTIRHPYDKHPMNLSYLPIENHKSEYFCEVCENVLNPHACFYHCDECSQSLHSACAPAICCETTTYSDRRRNISQHINLKFGSIHKIDGHSHPLLFAQGIKSDGQCSICSKGLRYMILKCLQCKYAIDYECCERLNLMNNS
ncbi:uncharacterized protein LOC110879718 isoform X3 [Helianthus annuus]|uniref:uncharacterized protein LOC110879718 isoform X3 n=1 Tax=Helianthus annuus TaxID=4232 RepID=UPI000B8F46C4|nr:uncharacterized protein LOC110879718 isoform X3 [Helianthus annuus]